MKLSLLQNTSAFQFGVRPAVTLRDMSHVPLPQVIKSVNAFFDTPNIFGLCNPGTNQGEAPKGNCERDAIVFYMLNHAVSMVRQGLHPYEPIPPKRLALVNEYHDQLSARATRMFFYLLLICTREARHEKGSAKVASLNYDPVILKHHKESMGESAVISTMRSTPINVPIGAFTSFLAEQFHKGSYSGGYGGKAWGKVADVLRDFVHGKLSAEMMLDTAFTLCHNNGPIFNKGMLFDHYSDEIYKILDVQRSGQIPQMVFNGETPLANDPLVKSLFNRANDALDGKLMGHVDWYAVEALGALKKYPHEKEAQAQKYGIPEGSKDDLPDVDAYGSPVHKSKTLMTPKKKMSHIDPFEIMPGVFVEKCLSRPTA